MESSKGHKRPSAVILFQSFLRESIVSSSDIGMDVHPSTVSVQHFLCRPRQTHQEALKERLPWRVQGTKAKTCPPSSKWKGELINSAWQHHINVSKGKEKRSRLVCHNYHPRCQLQTTWVHNTLGSHPCEEGIPRQSRYLEFYAYSATAVCNTQLNHWFFFNSR